MYYKEDWEASRKRFEALWQGETLDRCCISVTAPRPGSEDFFARYDRYLREGGWPAEHFFQHEPHDPEALLKLSEEVMAHTFYGGESYPRAWLMYGPAGHAAYFGAKPVVMPTTVWYDPVIDDIMDHGLVYDENNPILQAQLAAADYLTAHGKGKFMVAIPDNTGSMDVLGSLRDGEEMLMDMITEPEAVEAARDAVIDGWRRSTDLLYEHLRDINNGGSCVGWLSMWAPGNFHHLQCDLSVNVSNEMFKRFFLPELQVCSQHLDHALYHLDGCAQLRHLDDILSVPGIGVIQWTSVVGQPGYMHYIDVFKKIQAAGKTVLLNEVKAQDVEPLLDALGSEKLLIVTGAASQPEAEALLRMAEKHRVHELRVK